MDNVNSLLSKSIPLSKNAQSFKLLFENSQKTPLFPQGGAAAGPPKFADFLTNPAILGLASATLLGGKNPGKSRSTDLLSLPEQCTKLHNGPITEKSSDHSKMEIYMIEDLKKYIDQKFALLEKQIFEKLEDSERRTNAKLDLILSKLESNS